MATARHQAGSSRWAQGGLAAVDVVKDYRRMAEQMREMELQRALRALARGEDPQRIVTQLARGITNKLIHAPTAGLRQASADGRQDLLAHARKLLGLAAGLALQGFQLGDPPLIGTKGKAAKISVARRRRDRTKGAMVARIAGVDIPNEKRIATSLTYIFGIGPHRAQEICKKADIDPETKLRAVNDALLMLRDIFLIHLYNLRSLYDPQD